MATTTYLQNKLLAATLGNVAYSTTPYAALYSVAPTSAGGGTELSGSGYARQAVSFNATGGTATSTANVVFGAASADWTPAVAWAICDSSTGGNILYYGSLSPSQTVLNTKSLTFATGDISISIA